MLKLNHSLKIGGGYLLKLYSDSILRSLNLFVLNFRPNEIPHRHPEPLCHAELVSGSESKRPTKSFRNEFGMTSIPNKRFFAFAQNDRMHNKAAFTLAEVLITLGIIGIVAALTIPGLMTAYKKHRIATKLEKAVSTINQAVKLSEVENGEMETWDKSLSKVEFIDKYFRPYIKIMQICEKQRSCGYDSSPWKYLNGTTNGSYNSPFNNGRVPFISMDGILYTFAYNPDVIQADNDKVIIIDINASEKPNIFGQDVFFLYRIEEEDSIIPYGAHLPQSSINRDCSFQGAGMYCAAVIRANGWKIPGGYPLK